MFAHPFSKIWRWLDLLVKSLVVLKSWLDFPKLNSNSDDIIYTHLMPPIYFIFYEDLLVSFNFNFLKT